uniref:Uncharacterized protein n=1 Tax=Daphnia galeata TaxID=27404 RepID=A0A8J2RDB1_9CRUS|nr:unnamed protein product [Daphnia galeata]
MLDNPTFTTALDNSVVNPILANQKGITFSVSDKWTHPTVSLFTEKHYTRIGLWTSLAISKTTINDEEVAKSMLARKVCATRNKLDRYRHLVPGFNKYTESNCKYAFRQKRVTQTVHCFLTTLPYEGIYISFHIWETCHHVVRNNYWILPG